MQAAEIIVWIFFAYAIAGVAFAAWFVIFAVSSLDDAAKGSGWLFRLVILPASAALWPLLAWRLLTGSKPPVESNSHRRAAHLGDDR